MAIDQDFIPDLFHYPLKLVLFLQLSLILLICHWMACGWYAVSIQGVSDYLATYAKLESEIEQFLSNGLPKVTKSNDFLSFGNDSLAWESLENYKVWNDDLQTVISKYKCAYLWLNKTVSCCKKVRCVRVKI